MTDESCVRIFKEAFECGSVVFRKKAPPARDAWQWGATSRAAAKVLDALLPYFYSARVREKALLALEFQAQKRIGAARHIEGYSALQLEYFERMRALNVRGTSGS